MNTFQNRKTTNRIERTRTIILDFGYNLVVHKSRIKKALATFKTGIQSKLSSYRNTCDSEVSMITTPTK